MTYPIGIPDDSRAPLGERVTEVPNQQSLKDVQAASCAKGAPALATLLLGNSSFFIGSFRLPFWANRQPYTEHNDLCNHLVLLVSDLYSPLLNGVSTQWKCVEMKWNFLKMDVKRVTFSCIYHVTFIVQ